MGLFSKSLMKWREPKVKGMVTFKNILTAIALILIVSIPFGFLHGNGNFSIFIYFLALAFMSAAVISLSIESLLPGEQIQLREDAIVCKMPKRNQKSAYKHIDCIHYDRDCSYCWEGNRLIVNVHQRSVEGPNFTNFKVIMKNDAIVGGVLQFSYGALRSLHQFAVTDEVNLEQVLQILRDKGVKVIEGALPS